MTTLKEQAEWHEERAIEEDNNARDLGDCDDGAMTSKLRKMLRDRHEHDAARHRASAAGLQLLIHTWSTDRGSNAWMVEGANLKKKLDSLLSEIPHA